MSSDISEIDPILSPTRNEFLAPDVHLLILIENELTYDDVIIIIKIRDNLFCNSIIKTSLPYYIIYHATCERISKSDRTVILKAD